MRRYASTHTRLGKRLGLLNTKDFIKAAADRGEQGASLAMAQYSRLGNKLAMAHKGVTVAQAAYRPPIEVPSTETVFQPGLGVQYSFVEARMDVEYESPELQLDWNNSDTSLQYIPGELNFEIEQYRHRNRVYGFAKLCAS